MATDHSTETTAKLLKAIHPEADTLWVLCVALCVCMCLCNTVCVRNRMFPSHSGGSSPHMSEMVQYTMASLLVHAQKKHVYPVLFFASAVSIESKLRNKLFSVAALFNFLHTQSKPAM